MRTLGSLCTLECPRYSGRTFRKHCTSYAIISLRPAATRIMCFVSMILCSSVRPFVIDGVKHNAIVRHCRVYHLYINTQITTPAIDQTEPVSQQSYPAITRTKAEPMGYTPQATRVQRSDQQLEDPLDRRYLRGSVLGKGGGGAVSLVQPRGSKRYAVLKISRHRRMAQHELAMLTVVENHRRIIRMI